MKVIGHYQEAGYAHLQGLIPPEVARAFLHGLKQDIGPGPIPLSKVESHPNLLRRAAFEVYGHHYKPMLFFLWGLTPIVSSIVDRDLLPTYDYFRVYREGDVCRVHWDRYSCEHSLSLTLDYSDGEPWDLQIGTERTEPFARVEEDFGDEPYASVAMTPNPNAWSAHLFLHWVDRDGPHREHAFDGNADPAQVNFSFA